MSRSSIEAGSAYVRLFVKNELGPGLKSAKDRLDSFAKTSAVIGGSFTAAGGGIAAGIAASLAGFVSSGDELSKLADRTGASVEALSELRYAAGQSDVSMSALEIGFKQMGKTIAEASQGSAQYTEALDRIGLSAMDLVELPVEERFMLLADRISSIVDPSIRAAAAMEIFGRSGTELLPLLVDGERGIVALRQRARELGLTMSGEQAAAATLLGDTWDDLTNVFRRAVVTVGTELAPRMQELLDKIIPLIVRGSEIVGQYSYLARYLPEVAVGLLSVGAAFFGLSVAAQAASVGIAAVQGVIALVAAGPVIFALTLIGAAIALAWQNSEGFGAYLSSTFLPIFQSLKDIAVGVWEGITSALKAGDLKAAGDIAMLGLQAAMAAGMVGIIKMWEDLKYTISEAMAGAVLAALNAFEKIATSPYGMALGLPRVAASNMRNAIGALRENVLGGLQERRGDRDAAVADAQSRSTEAAAKLSERAAEEKARAPQASTPKAPPVNLDDLFEDKTTTTDWLRNGYADNMPQFQQGMQTIAGWLGKAGSFAQAAAKFDPLGKGESVNWWDAIPQNPFEEPKDFEAPKIGGTATGTFSSAAAGYLGMGGGSPAERTAKGIEKLYVEVRRLTDVNERQEKILKAQGIFI